MNFMPARLIPDEEVQEGPTAESFEALADMAITHLAALPTKAVIVSGPITTGGTGHQILNLEIFNAAIRGLEKHSSTFNQIPYERGLRQLCAVRSAEEVAADSYCLPILETFYARVFASGLINAGYFLPGWQSSRGATWEHDEMVRLGIPVNEIMREEVREFLLADGHDAAHTDMIMGLLPQE